MDANDYTTAWLIYIGAAVVLSVLGWGFLKRFLPRELAYLLQCWLLALLFTPWYVLEDQELLAPALIVFALDTVTIAPVAGVRALTPLALALMAGLLVAVLLSIIYRVRRPGEPQPASPLVSDTPAGSAAALSTAGLLPGAEEVAPRPRAPRRKKAVERVEPVLPPAGPEALEERTETVRKPRRKSPRKVPADPDPPQS